MHKHFPRYLFSLCKYIIFMHLILKLFIQLSFLQYSALTMISYTNQIKKWRRNGKYLGKKGFQVYFIFFLQNVAYEKSSILFHLFDYNNIL